jgi:hypothetical protein
LLAATDKTTAAAARESAGADALAAARAELAAAQRALASSQAQLAAAVSQSEVPTLMSLMRVNHINETIAKLKSPFVLTKHPR